MTSVDLCCERCGAEGISAVTKSKNNMEKKKGPFVSQFVNTVYGIILGYGISDSLSSIKEHYKSDNVGQVGTIYELVAVLYIVIVICVYWWDWVDNIGFRTRNSAREFVLDITILISLECLFFVYEYPFIFALVFFMLSVLNFIWVCNFRFNEYYAWKAFDKTKTWSKYLSTNDLAKNHIYKRFYGILLFGACVLFSVASSYHFLDNIVVKRLIDSEFITENWSGYWTVLLVILCSGLFNRLVLYRDRFERKPKGVD